MLRPYATWFPLCVRGLLAERACLITSLDQMKADSLQKNSQPQPPWRLLSLVTLRPLSWKSHLSLKLSLIEMEILVWYLSSFLDLLQTALVPHLQFHTRAMVPPLMPSVPVADSTNRYHFRDLCLLSFYLCQLSSGQNLQCSHPLVC